MKELKSSMDEYASLTNKASRIFFYLVIYQWILFNS